MRWEIVSDLHLEKDDIRANLFQVDNSNGCGGLILAGDIVPFVELEKHMVFFEQVAAAYKYVIYVPGNHEVWNHNLGEIKDQLTSALAAFPNIYILQGDTVDIEGTVFFGATLWTSFNNGNPMAMNYALNNINDYKSVRVGPGGWRRIGPIDILEEHRRHWKLLQEAVDKYPELQIITHHAPSFLSVPDKFRDAKFTDLNHAFGNSFENYIIDHPSIKNWIHGHCHQHKMYSLGQTQVIVNPFGYPGENTGYVKLAVELN